MEKVEKLLLLVVLGAAMVIMAVMSFGSEDPANPSKKDPNGGIQQASREGPADPREAGQEQQTIDDLDLNKTIDGPELVKSDDKQAEIDPLAGGKKPAGTQSSAGGPDSGGKSDFPGGPKAGSPSGSGTQSDPMAPPSIGVETANVHLAPGDEPGIWIYTVQPKDSLSGIMERITGSTRNVAEIIAGWNEGMDQNVIRPGQKIQIPESMILGYAKPNATARRTSSQGTMALRRRMPVPGMIEAPVAAPVAVSGAGPVNASSARTRNQATPASTRRPVAPRTESYSIKKGETLWAIAKRRVGERGANAYVRQIQELNPGLEPSELRPKDVIQLPTR